MVASTLLFFRKNSRPLLASRWLACAIASVSLAIPAATWALAEPESIDTEQLRSIREILELTDEEAAAGRPAVVRGVVTLASPHVVIDDGSDAIYVGRRPGPGEVASTWQERSLGVPVAVGTEVEVRGLVDLEGFIPRLVIESIQEFGKRSLPEPAAIDFTRLFAGGDNGRRVKTKGVVQAVLDNPEGWSLIFESASRRFRVIVSKDVLPARPDAWIDAELEVVGVCFSYRNSRGEFVAPGVLVGRPEDLRVIRDASQGPFDLPITPLSRIARFRLEPLGGHRLRTTGVVSFAVPGMLYLQEGVGGVRVDLASKSEEHGAFREGDRVDVAGFPTVNSGIGAISWAVARKISDDAVPPPVPIQPREILRLNQAGTVGSDVARPGSYDGCLIRCRGRVEAVNRSPTGMVLTLIDEGSAFTATLPDAKTTDALAVPPGSEVEVTGIVTARRKGLADGEILRGSLWLSQIELLIRSDADIRVLRLPPWWTPWRLAAAALAACSIAAAAFVWVATLRREVARQTARTLAEESARFKDTIDYEVTLRERSRLAANLHDTILQTVTGIGYQLQACQAEDARPGRLDVARRMVGHAVEQLRGTVWALQTPPVGGDSLRAALEERLSLLEEGFNTPISLRFTGRERRLAETATANLVLVAQEAVTNAQRHASAEKIEVAFTIDDESVTLVVRDDGRGFDMETRPGPAEGHFGIDGMIDRMQAIGGTLTCQSASGRGTTIAATAPTAALEEHPSDRTGAEPADHGSMVQ